MKEKYNELFKIYLSAASGEIDKTKGPDELRKRIEQAERFSLKLIGMVTLLRECGHLSLEEEAVETNRIMESFSSGALFNAFVINGEVYTFPGEVNE